MLLIDQNIRYEKEIKWQRDEERTIMNKSNRSLYWWPKPCGLAAHVRLLFTPSLQQSLSKAWAAAG